MFLIQLDTAGFENGTGARIATCGRNSEIFEDGPHDI